MRKKNPKTAFYALKYAAQKKSKNSILCAKICTFLRL